MRMGLPLQGSHCVFSVPQEGRPRRWLGGPSGEGTLPPENAPESQGPSKPNILTSVWRWIGYRSDPGLLQRATHICLPAHFIKFSDLSHTTTILRAHAGRVEETRYLRHSYCQLFPLSASPAQRFRTRPLSQTN